MGDRDARLRASSAVFLESARRLPRAPRRPRPSAFYDRFEDRALAYDCFWHADGTRVLVVGPPPLNLMPALRAATVRALPSGVLLAPRHHLSESVMVTELGLVPPDTREIVLGLGDTELALAVRPSGAAEFAGRRVLFTMSRDNDLAWIAEWAGYHARHHGADAIVFFDNGSTRYGADDIAVTLGSVPGIERIAVHSWPWCYGAPDPAVVNNPFYTLFLQVSAMSVTLRRYAEGAAGLLNCDIDELVAAPERRSVFDIVRTSPRGLLVFTGEFIEPVPRPGSVSPFTHRDFAMRLKEEAGRLSRPRKWALDPGRRWVRNLSVHPYMHWIHGRPAFSKTRYPDVFYWHFKGISTGWKDDRAEAGRLDAADLECDERLPWSSQGAKV